jgi:hypothetical protein
MFMELLIIQTPYSKPPAVGSTNIGGAQVSPSLLTSTDPGDFPGQPSSFPNSIYRSDESGTRPCSHIHAWTVSCDLMSGRKHGQYSDKWDYEI